ncbi:ABC transporter ATP-binding protein [Brotaphodocola sp.]|uniref:ABC transporter ATP-binding protein n=1 Tax=Brotaphodocola sp. TaxID=3073577 RepID=UPI003D7DE828
MVPILDVQNLSYSYHSMDGATLALSNISFQIGTGEFVAIVGPSGCGKSTLLSLISGLLRPEEGSIFLKGKPICGPDVQIGYMLQKDHLLEWRTILDNAALGLEIRKQKTPETMKELKAMLETYGLSGFESAHPSELSGGMRQRAALIRTLALKPDLLFLDEPFSALDYQTRLSVCDDISAILRSAGKTALLITHDLAEAISIADRILILTARPGTIKASLTIHFSPEADTPLKRRNAPEFAGYFNEVWGHLQTESI